MAFALRRDAGTGVQARALPYVIGAAIGLSGVAAAVAGEGLMSPALAVVGVLLCLFTVVGGLRAGVLAAAIGAGMLVLLARGDGVRLAGAGRHRAGRRRCSTSCGRC